MPYNVIDLSKLKGPFQDALKRIMEMIPSDQREDVKLTKLIAFRLKLDGEKKTAYYLKGKVQAAMRSNYKGRLFDFLIDDVVQKTEGPSSDPPDMVG